VAVAKGGVVHRRVSLCYGLLSSCSDSRGPGCREVQNPSVSASYVGKETGLVFWVNNEAARVKPRTPLFVAICGPNTETRQKSSPLSNHSTNMVTQSSILTCDGSGTIVSFLTHRSHQYARLRSVNITDQQDVSQCRHCTLLLIGHGNEWHTHGAGQSSQD
jgi:hypothetical protein